MNHHCGNDAGHYKDDEDDQQNFLTAHGCFLSRSTLLRSDAHSLLDSTKGDTQGLTVWFHCILNGCLGVRDGFRDGRLGARSQKISFDDLMISVGCIEPCAGGSPRLE